MGKDQLNYLFWVLKKYKLLIYFANIKVIALERVHICSLRSQNKLIKEIKESPSV